MRVSRLTLGLVLAGFMLACISLFAPFSGASVPAWTHCGTPQAEADCPTTTSAPTTTTTVVVTKHPPVTTDAPPVVVVTPPTPPTPVVVPPHFTG